MAFLGSDRLLSVWEQGVRRHPIDRGLLLFAIASPETPPAQLADLPLSRRNAALMALYETSFGSRLAGWVDCPDCGERMEFVTDTSSFPRSATTAVDPIEVRSLRFLRPTSRHLAKLTHVSDPEAAARQLLLACAESPEALPDDKEAVTAMLDEVESAMEEADPWADITVAVRCPACTHEEAATLDIADLLWEEISARAHCLLDDVHVLAQTYGWSEPEVLALSDARRAAYLERVRS
ncbi:MAG: hypothetical protein PVJ33_05930 [Lysobacterales bacterium]